MMYGLVFITLLSVIGAVWKKKPILLTTPFALLGIYLIIQVAMVPLPFWDTVKFIFSLR
jgi:hypothetical protein